MLENQHARYEQPGRLNLRCVYAQPITWSWTIEVDTCC